MEPGPQEITSLVGREVYSNNGVYVGEVEDVRLDMDGKTVTGLAITDVNQELFESYVDGQRGVMIPYRWVRAVGDVVLINDAVERLKTGEAEEDAAA
jgi:sporulation protein YlmC with PRC-barrel domain